MGIKVDQNSLKRTISRLGAIPNVVLSSEEEVFSEVGSDIVEKISRGELSSWNDNTSNLRSSIGGGVIRKGIIVNVFGFFKVLDGTDGVSKGKELLELLASEYAQYDVVLIIVAGMEYAVYLEAIEGKVVLSSGLLHLEHVLPNLLKERISEALKEL